VGTGRRALAWQGSRLKLPAPQEAKRLGKTKLIVSANVPGKNRGQVLADTEAMKKGAKPNEVQDLFGESDLR